MSSGRSILGSVDRFTLLSNKKLGTLAVAGAPSDLIFIYLTNQLVHG